VVHQPAGTRDLVPSALPYRVRTLVEGARSRSMGALQHSNALPVSGDREGCRGMSCMLTAWRGTAQDGDLTIAMTKVETELVA